MSITRSRRFSSLVAVLAVLLIFAVGITSGVLLSLHALNSWNDKYVLLILGLFPFLIIIIADYGSLRLSRTLRMKRAVAIAMKKQFPLTDGVFSRKWEHRVHYVVGITSMIIGLAMLASASIMFWSNWKPENLGIFDFLTSGADRKGVAFIIMFVFGGFAAASGVAMMGAGVSDDR